MGGSDAGGEGDDNPFVALCNNGVLDECAARTDSDEATTNVPNLGASQPPNLANILGTFSPESCSNASSGSFRRL